LGRVDDEEPKAGPEKAVPEAEELMAEEPEPVVEVIKPPANEDDL
jgi:hypothetical protein